jgi:predicted nucleic acid-binding protein
MILVDTSVFIDYLKGKNNSEPISLIDGTRSSSYNYIH